MLQVTDTENKYWEHEGFVVSQQQLSGHLNHILRFPPVLISDPFLCDNFSALLTRPHYAALVLSIQMAIFGVNFMLKEAMHSFSHP